MQSDIKLGDTVEDTVSGFTGVVTTIGDHITGCERFGVRPYGEAPSDRAGEVEYFYEAQLEKTEVEDYDFTDEGAQAQTETEFELGETVQDKVTGVRGTVIIINYKLWNCPQIAVEPDVNSGVLSDSNNEAPELFWSDDVRLESVDDGLIGEFDNVQQSTDTTEKGSISDSGNRSVSSNRSLEPQ